MEIEIERIGINGEGIGKIPSGESNGKIAFVDFALPREIVDIDITKEYKSYCKCRVDKFIRLSNERVIPECKYFEQCGGCDIQHMNKDCQLLFKKKIALDVFQKIDENIKDVDIIRLNDFHYRNKMVFPFGLIENKIVLGMYRKGSHDIVDIDGCLLAKENTNKILKITKEYFANNSNLFVLDNDKIVLKYLVVRELNDKIMVAIVSNKKCDLKDYLKVLTSNFENVILSNIIANSEDEILSGKLVPITQNQEIELNEFGINYSVNIMSFLQVNNEIKSELYKQILDYIDDNDFVFDAFSGAGLLSAILSKKCRGVVGIEINKFAHNIANDLKDKNNLKNLNNICGDANVILPKLCKSYKNSVLILDPARSGCGKEMVDFLSNIHDYLPKSIVYVSCNLATLQRDLNEIKNNYLIKQVKIWDMFPQTKHIESLVYLQRRV